MNKYINVKLVGKDDIIIKDMGNKKFEDSNELKSWLEHYNFVQIENGRLPAYKRRKNSDSYYFAIIIK